MPSIPELASSAAAAPVPILYVHFGENWIRGSERALLDLLANLDRSRFLPHVWTNCEPLALAVSGLGLTCRVEPFPLLLDHEPPRWDFVSYARLIRSGVRLVREHGIGLLHANSGAPTQWLVPVARRTRLPLVAHLHAPYDLRERCAFLLHQASCVVGVSAAILRDLIEDGVPPERTRVIYNGVDLAHLERGDARGLRESLRITPQEVVLTAVGSLIPRKGFDVLLEATARLVRRGLPVRLLVVGEGPDLTLLREQARSLGLEGRAHFLRERTDVGAIYRDATDIAVAAARSEAFGLSSIEAGAFGVPVVATAVDGVPEVVEDGVTGRLVPPDDPAALAGAIEALARDPVERRRLGDAGRTRVLERFSAARQAAAFSMLYTDLLTRRRSAGGESSPRFLPGPWLRFARRSFARRFRGASRA